jgi:hypothetical protein
MVLICAPSAGAALPVGYDAVPAQGIPLPPPIAADHFGTTMVNDGGLLLVGVPGANNGDGAIVIVNPVSGETRRVNAPLEPSHTGRPTAFGASVAVIPDIGKCQSVGDAGKDCTASANTDNVPDLLVGAPGGDLRSGKGVDLGRVYVLDGATFAVMKRLQVGPTPTSTQQDPDPTVPGAPTAGTPDFGRSVSSASGMPPCLGSGGIGTCPSFPEHVAAGDVDGGGKPDIVVGAPQYRETQDTNPACTHTGACQATGRVYVFKGEDLTAPGTAAGLGACIPNTSFPDTCDGPHLVGGLPITYPYPEESTGPPAFGQSVMPIGDVGSCAPLDFVGTICPASSVRNVRDGVPDLLVSGPGVDVGSTSDAGAAFVIDGASMTILEHIDSPNPQQSAGFGTFSPGQRAFGDLLGSELPDIYVGGFGQDGVPSLGQGRGYVYTGDATASPQLLATAEDPTPVADGGFGATVAPIGDIAGDAPGELLVGEAGSAANDVHIYSACANKILQTIGAPSGAGGFGNSVAPVGDVNGDGFADFAVGAPGTDSNAGRIYIMKSVGAPGPAFAGCNAGGGGGSDGGGGGGGGNGSGGNPGGNQVPRKRNDGGKNVSSLVKRSLVLTASKDRVKVGSSVTLAGKLRSKNRSACQTRQKVAIQRFQDTFWVTVDVAVTKRSGAFQVIVTPNPAKTFFFRARVSQTKRCVGSTSKRVKVTAVP